LVVQIAALVMLMLPGAWLSGSVVSTLQAPATVPAQELVSQVQKGEPVDLQAAVIEGDLDLRSVEAVKRPLRCQACHFRGSFNATLVVFDRLVDLSKSTIEGTLELEGAVFRQRAIFDQARFFDAELATAHFLDNVSFNRTIFQGRAALDRAHVNGNAGFFRSTFQQDAGFEGTEFQGRVDFTIASFEGRAGFQRAEFRGGGAFRVTRFHGQALFDLVRAGDSLDFEGAFFQGEPSFQNLSSSGSLSLVGVRLGGAELFTDGLTVQSFSMDVPTVELVRGEKTKKRLLQLIEQSAEASHDLALANDARFQFLTLESKKHDSIGHLMDILFYRGVAGYLVRPSHPLIAFFLAIGVATLMRGVLRLWVKSVGRWRQRQEEGGRPHTMGFSERLRRGILDSQKTFALLLGGLTESLAAAFRPKPGIRVSDPDCVRQYFVAGTRWLEFLTYKFLIAIFLIALGNSNATFRQILEAVRQ
jgi:hypothetical protein